jgi:hypothetical protein
VRSWWPRNTTGRLHSPDDRRCRRRPVLPATFAAPAGLARLLPGLSASPPGLSVGGRRLDRVSGNGHLPIRAATRNQASQRYLRYDMRQRRPRHVAEDAAVAATEQQNNAGGRSFMSLIRTYVRTFTINSASMWSKRDNKRDTSKA